MTVTVQCLIRFEFKVSFVQCISAMFKVNFMNLDIDHNEVKKIPS
jgi:hypothetical protein